MRIGMSDRFVKTFHPLTLSNSFNSCTNPFKFLTHFLKGNLTSLTPCHFTLQKGEIFRIPSAYREIHVLSGIAWITVGGKDIILNSGEKALLTSYKGSALLSALGKLPLILEVL